MANVIRAYLEKQTKAAPLAVFRLFFGLLMAVSIIRFWYHGWIEKLYLEPSFHFHYDGFHWVQVPADALCYLLFIICGLSALFVAFGLHYRLSIIAFFLSFTYIELMDKTTYLNHYYFISVVAFILIFLPAERHFSLDSYRKPDFAREYIPRWNIDVLKLMLAIVYIYAGLAKFHPDWMLRALPLGIWLPSKFDTPLIGSLMHKKWLHFAFSWAGAFYDVLIVFFLMWRRTRLLAFVAVVIFHLLTRILFPIGMFPFIMIASTLIFFSDTFHETILRTLSRLLGRSYKKMQNGLHLLHTQNRFSQFAFRLLVGLMILQILLPLRFLLYPGNVFWTEQGYRFAWRVMLMEKTGYANFKIVDGKTGKRFYVQNEDFLTAFQQKQMSTQADFIIEYAHYLAKRFEEDGHQNIEVYVESYVSLNGRKSQLYIDPTIDLTKIENNLQPRHYILPFHE